MLVSNIILNFALYLTLHCQHKSRQVIFVAYWKLLTDVSLQKLYSFESNKTYKCQKASMQVRISGNSPTLFENL